MIKITGNIGEEKQYLTDFSQAVANFLPDYFISRQTKYSIFQTLIASYGILFEEYIGLAKDGANPFNTIHSYRNEIPVYYDINLGQNWVFDYAIGTDLATSFVPPIVKGYFSDDTNVTLQISGDNSIRHYRKLIPTRLNYNEFNRFPKSGYVFNGKIDKKKVRIAKYLNSDSYLFVNIITRPSIDKAVQELPEVIISGRDYADKEIDEVIQITHDGQFKTLSKFLYIDSVWANNIDSKVLINNPFAHIASTVSGGAGVTTITTTEPHGFTVGDSVTIENTQDYNGTYSITAVGSTTTFNIAMDWTSSQTGSVVLTLDGPFEIEIYDHPKDHLNYPIKELRERSFNEDESNNPIQIYYEYLSTADGVFLHTFYYNQQDPLLNLPIQTKKTINKYELYDVFGSRVTGVISVLPSLFNTYLYVLGEVSGVKYLYVFDKRDEISALFKEYNGFEPSPEAYLNVSYVGYNRKILYTGTGVTASGSNSITFTDVTKTWATNELSGMSLEVAQQKYWILSNTSDTITVSTFTNDFEYIETIAPIPTAYQIKYLETRAEPFKVKGTGTPTRIQISVKHDNSSELFFDGVGFQEDGPIWITNQRQNRYQNFAFEEMVMNLPFSGNYLVTFTCEFQDGAKRYTNVFKNIYFVGEKTAKAQFNLTNITADGTDPLSLFSDYGDVRLLTNKETLVSNALIGNTSVSLDDVYSGVISKPIGAGLTVGSTVTISTPGVTPIANETHNPTGDGTPTATFTITNTPVVPNSVSITDSQANTVTWIDDGNGILTPQDAGTVNGVSGVINYTSGIVTLTYSGNVSLGATTEVDYQYYNLLNDTWTFTSIGLGVFEATGSTNGAKTIGSQINSINGAFILAWDTGYKPTESVQITATYTYDNILSQILEFKKDYMTIDFTNKIIHCFEKYEYVDVKTVEEVNSPTVVISTDGFPASEDFNDGGW